MEDILAITLLFGGGTLFLLAISPVGRAIGDRIRGGGARVGQDTVEQLRESQMAVLDELDALRQELTDVQERLDFAERLLARQREVGELPRGEEVGR
ncbi:MAG: hypothetical protein GTN62_00825 [Gemmatimonadales bacterium]|nr:hypothetical protein [Gemmatimonadales bacterium]NIN48646.1 hypothetical protein [Gemmatimonadales bacterium]NIP06110.1 hypothetical protein [Gemmatimonadales bacterium]NIR01284.1 hypothetical protein [Gemmatimonadales bacterium]